MDIIEESIREIDSSHWLIENMLLLTHEKSPNLPNNASWNDGKGGFFTLSDAPKPQPPTKPLTPGSEIHKVHEGGTLSVVWRAGEAFIKVKQIEIPGATREHTTLEYLHQHRLDGFSVPSVYFNTECNGRYLIVLSKLSGQTLSDIWPTMTASTKDTVVDRIAAICESLSAWTGNAISGVDGHHLSDSFLVKRSSNDLGSHALLQNCQGQGMDCSSLVFYHCDLGPGNIIVGPQNSIGIIDWETAGFVPREWIRTKFRISSGMDLPLEGATERTEWRRRVSQRLQEMGFQDVAGGWASWWNS